MWFFLLQESVEVWLGQVGTPCCREEQVKAVAKKKNPTKNLCRNPLAIAAFLENSQKRQAVMILPLSALLGSNYFQLRLFSVSDTTYPCWMILLATCPASPCPPVNFPHPRVFASICCLGFAVDLVDGSLLIPGLDKMV